MDVGASGNLERAETKRNGAPGSDDEKIEAQGRGDFSRNSLGNCARPPTNAILCTVFRIPVGTYCRSRAAPAERFERMVEQTDLRLR